jgi:Zn finger protein HypA/HybF involved in hydrogenase expression
MISNFTDTVVQLNKFPPEQYNVLIPVTSLQVMSNMQRIMVNEVQLNTDVNKGGDIYFEKSSSKYAITKVGGMKLAAAANISIVSSESVTPDICIKCIDMTKATKRTQVCGTCPHGYDVKYVVTVRVPEPSGGFRLISKDKEIDCEMESKSMKPEQYKRFLPHRASIAESKAFMRCIRDALGLKAGYTLDELKKPFIIAHVVPNLDAPEIRQAIAGSYLKSMGLLFEIPAEQKRLTASAAPLERTELPSTPPPEEGGYTEGDFSHDHGEDDDVELPWEEGGRIACEECGEEIVETVNRKGVTWMPEEIKDYSLARFDSVLCPKCQQKAVKEAK